MPSTVASDPHGRGVFVCGTDTGVGKTTVSAGLLRALVQAGAIGARGWKPVVSGAVGGESYAPGAPVKAWHWEDLERLALADGAGESADSRAMVRLRTPAAPAFAAMTEGVSWDITALKAWCAEKVSQSGFAVVEGVGGLLVPLAHGFDMADLAVALDLPCVLVVGVRLGCINHALLTFEAMRSRGLRLAAWVANLGLDTDYGFVEETVTAIEQGLGQASAARLPRLSGGEALDLGQGLGPWRAHAERQIGEAATQLEVLAATLLRRRVG